MTFNRISPTLQIIISHMPVAPKQQNLLFNHKKIKTGTRFLYAANRTVDIICIGKNDTDYFFRYIIRSIIRNRVNYVCTFCRLGSYNFDRSSDRKLLFNPVMIMFLHPYLQKRLVCLTDSYSRKLRRIEDSSVIAAMSEITQKTFC